MQVLDGQTHVGIDNGSLGRSANGKAPVLSPSGQVIGQVSVGILETTVASQLAAQSWVIALYLLIALAVGVTVALLLARSMKRKTYRFEVARDQLVAAGTRRDAARDPGGRLGFRRRGPGHPDQ